MMDVSTDKWINIDEAAEYLGVKAGTIRGWIGKQWKFKCSELDKWIESGKSAMD